MYLQMSKVNISIDDVLIVTQMLGTVINKKLLAPDEFRRVQGPWERLSDAITQLQRKQSLDKLYPTPVPEQAVVPEKVPVPEQANVPVPDLVPIPVPVPTTTESVDGETESDSKPVGADLSV
mgnify:CR=1 FL=1